MKCPKSGTKRGPLELQPSLQPGPLSKAVKLQAILVTEVLHRNLYRLLYKNENVSKLVGF